MNDPLNIKNEMAQFDNKNRAFYDDLTTEEKKKFSPYLMIRWGTSVSGSADLQAYYLINGNQNLNKNYFDINSTQHKKLLWLLATTVSPGLGVKYHQWIPPKKKESDNKHIKFLKDRYPHLKESDIALLSKINSKQELKQYAQDLGWTDKEIKKEL